MIKNRRKKKPEFDPEQTKIIAKAVENYRAPCLICHGTPEMTGVFIPVTGTPFANEMKVPSNKMRVIPYCLCLKCYGTTSKDQIESELMRLYKETPTVINLGEPPVFE